VAASLRETANKERGELAPFQRALQNFLNDFPPKQLSLLTLAEYNCFWGYTMKMFFLRQQ